MLDTVLEEDNVHGGIVRVVKHEKLFKARNKDICLTEHDVVLVPWVFVVTENNVFETFKLPIETHFGLHLLVHELTERPSVGGIDESITEDTEHLTSEQFDAVVLVDNFIKRAHKHTLDDLGQITQVESVMTLRGSRKESLLGLVVGVYSSLDDIIAVVRQSWVSLKVEVTL